MTRISHLALLALLPLAAFAAGCDWFSRPAKPAAAPPPPAQQAPASTSTVPEGPAPASAPQHDPLPAPIESPPITDPPATASATAPPVTPAAPAAVPSHLAPAYIEHDLPSIWLRNVPGRESRGEVEAAFLLRPAPGRPYDEIPVARWAREAVATGAVFFAVFSQDAKQPGWSGGNEGWPLKGTPEYAAGQLAHLHKAAAALRATGVDLSSVRIFTDIENKHTDMVPLAARIATELGFTIDSTDSHWAANFGSGPDQFRWINVPALDGRTTGIISYNMAGDGDRTLDEVQAEIDAAKRAVGGKGRYVVWYRTNSAWAASMLPIWRADPACRAVVGWTPN